MTCYGWKAETLVTWRWLSNCGGGGGGEFYNGVCIADRDQSCFILHTLQLLSIEQCTIFVQSTTAYVEIFLVDKLSHSFASRPRSVLAEIEITSSTCVGMGHTSPPRHGCSFVVKWRNIRKNAHTPFWQTFKVLCPWALFRKTMVYLCLYILCWSVCNQNQN